MDFTYPDSIPLASIPTPIEKLERLSVELGVSLFIKRDDKTDCLCSGNKIRKMEFLAADAQKKDCDTFITCGGAQSNHARTVAAVAAHLGMRSHLVLRKEDGIPDGNSLLDTLLGAEFTWITPEEYMNVNNLMKNIAEEMEKDGHKAYIIPVGGSNAMGSFGYIRCVEEIKKQEKELELEFDSIICACGSGGTHEGLFLGKKIFGLGASIISYNVGDTPNFFKVKIPRILNEVIQEFNLNIHYVRSEIDVRGGYMGQGYGISTAGALKTIKEVAQTEGIILDPVYTAKAFHGLVDEIKKGVYKKGSNILFIHTGGIYGIFPRREELISV